MDRETAEGHAVRYRLTGAQMTAVTAGAFLGGLLGGFLASLILEGFDAGAILISALALAAGCAYGLRIRAVTATDAGVIVHGFGDRSIPWFEVAEIEQSRSLGGSRLIMVESSGRRTRLPSPVDGRLLMRDRRFQDKAETLQYALVRSKARLR